MAEKAPEIVVYRGRELPSRTIVFGDGSSAWCNGTQCNVPADKCKQFEALPEVAVLLRKGIVKRDKAPKEEAPAKVETPPPGK